METILMAPSQSQLQFTSVPASMLRTHRSRKYHLHRCFKHQTLDRVNLLGDDDCGHTGCVNALSWARSGELLISAGDDTTVRIWGISPRETQNDYPFSPRSVIKTGHRANIFNAQMLPQSSCIATAAGDQQIRIFDVEALKSVKSARDSCVYVLQCHEDRVKRIVTEESPDLFLSVSEDGSVRQHDLRTHHNCTSLCPSPLVQVNHELSTLSLSPVTPYQFVVAGAAPYGYLFDRRHSGRVLREEWGEVVGDGKGITTCVRRFGRVGQSRNGTGRTREHITGARISPVNGHEVLLSYSGEGVYLYSTYDEITSKDDLTSPTPALLLQDIKPGNDKHKSCLMLKAPKPPDENFLSSANIEDIDETVTDSDEGDEDTIPIFMNIEKDYFDGEQNYELQTPLVLPRRRFSGALNVATIKDVNFLGPGDEFIVSGSDDGNFFVWDKASGSLHGIYEGDSSVVNVIEPHPHLPLVAVSGIDTTVKLFAPTSSFSVFSRMSNAQQIMETNNRLSRTRTISYSLLTRDNPQCANQ